MGNLFDNAQQTVDDALASDKKVYCKWYKIHCRLTYKLL